jgi:P-type E1-E2 ATPase
VQGFIRQLKNTRTLLLSGDGSETVKKVAHLCQFREWIAECLPLEKKKVIDALRSRGEIVAMLGDGINDAPALTSAHIGIAVASASDISVQVSDILLTTVSFDTLSLLQETAKKGHQIIKQNLFWAFFYNGVGIILAMNGVLTPLFAAIAMVLSSLIVLFNARRISSPSLK